MSAHRGPGLPRLSAYAVDYAPAHCAGGHSCLHAHAGEPALPVFADLSTPIVRCDRKGAHGSHDITTTGGDFRCPGLANAGLPAPRVVARAAQARAAMRSTR